MKRYSFLLALLLVFAIPRQLLAQHRDTLYVVEEEPVYDTLFVHDTLRTYDTVSLDEYIHSREFEHLFYSSGYVDSQQHPDSAKKLYRQTVTYWENHVLHNEQEKIANMDSIKKYGLAALIVLGLNGLVPGQTTDIQNEKPQSKIGYYFALGVDFGAGTQLFSQESYHPPVLGIQIHALNGMRLGRWLMLSLDFQLAYHRMNEYEYHFSVPMKNTSSKSSSSYLFSYDNLGIGLGIDFKYRMISSQRWSPIIGIAGGPSLQMVFYPKEFRIEYKDNYFIGGYATLYSGCSFKYAPNKHLYFGPALNVGIIGDLVVSFTSKFEIQL